MKTFGVLECGVNFAFPFHLDHRELVKVTDAWARVLKSGEYVAMLKTEVIREL